MNMNNLNEEEFEKQINDVIEKEAKTGDGAKAFEEWLAGPYKVEWHKIWEEGRLANILGQSRDNNPHKLKVWKAVWEYGFDNYNPNDQYKEFKEVDNHLKSLPTRPMQQSDF